MKRRRVVYSFHKLKNELELYEKLLVLIERESQCGFVDYKQKSGLCYLTYQILKAVRVLNIKNK